MIEKRLLYILFFGVPVTLIVTSSFLAKQTVDYKSANRTLILQNDSLRGVVIDLNRKLQEAEKAVQLNQQKQSQ